MCQCVMINYVRPSICLSCEIRCRKKLVLQSTASDASKREQVALKPQPLGNMVRRDSGELKWNRCDIYSSCD